MLNFYKKTSRHDEIRIFIIVAMFNPRSQDIRKAYARNMQFAYKYSPRNVVYAIHMPFSSKTYAKHNILSQTFM